jgi:CHAT domain-containing protein
MFAGGRSCQIRIPSRPVISQSLLRAAFFYAGARALLVSNWPVHSGATAKLMTTLFDLQSKDRSLARAAALQKTRLEMIDQGTQKDVQGKSIFSYAHPIFWAPFTIVGDGGGERKPL